MEGKNKTGLYKALCETGQMSKNKESWKGEA